MAKRAGAYKSDKRKKELQRLKKQEEKRQKRFRKHTGDTPGAEAGEQDEGRGEEPAQDSGARDSIA